MIMYGKDRLTRSFFPKVSLKVGDARIATACLQQLCDGCYTYIIDPFTYLSRLPERPCSQIDNASKRLKLRR